MTSVNTSSSFGSRSSSLGALPRNYIALLVLSVFVVFFPALSGYAIEFKDKLLEIVSERFGEDAAERLVDWQKLSKRLADESDSLSEIKQLTIVNDFFNQARFVDDQTLWNAEDYWATPVELLARNAGDCEDYAIAKFFTLLSAGFDEDKLQISYVKALELNQAHMVLAYYQTPDSEPLILDNINSNILPASERPDLEPVYSFNGLGLWLNRFERDKAKRLGGPEVMSNWNDMLRRQGIMILKQETNK